MATASSSSRSSRRRCWRAAQPLPGAAAVRVAEAATGGAPNGLSSSALQRTYPGPVCSGQPPRGRGSRAAGRQRPGPAGRCSRSPGSGRSLPPPASRPSSSPCGRPDPGRLTTTRVASLWISSWRSQRRQLRRPRPSPTIRNSSSSGPRPVQLGEGVRRVGLPAPVDLQPAGLQARHVAHGRLHQRQPVLGRAHRPLAGLLPGHIGHDQQHPVQVQRRPWR